MVSIVYVRLMMPYISAESMAGDGKRPQVKGVKAFFAPLKVLAPQKVRLAENGRVVKHRGVLFLCSGVFLGVVCGPLSSCDLEDARLIKMANTAGNRLRGHSDPAVCDCRVRISAG